MNSMPAVALFTSSTRAVGRSGAGPCAKASMVKNGRAAKPAAASVLSVIGESHRSKIPSTPQPLTWRAKRCIVPASLTFTRTVHGFEQNALPVAASGGGEAAGDALGDGA